MSDVDRLPDCCREYIDRCNRVMQNREQMGTGTNENLTRCELAPVFHLDFDTLVPYLGITFGGLE